MDLANLIYVYERRKGTQSSENELKALEEQILTIVKTENMTPLYLSLSAKFGWPEDGEIVSSMR